MLFRSAMNVAIGSCDARTRTGPLATDARGRVFPARSKVIHGNGLDATGSQCPCNNLPAVRQTMTLKALSPLWHTLHCRQYQQLTHGTVPSHTHTIHRNAVEMQGCPSDSNNLRSPPIHPSRPSKYRMPDCPRNSRKALTRSKITPLSSSERLPNRIPGC